ncbi:MULTISPECIES: hypothetical protein [unclassified Leifsonia]|uniref:hypothetical protein n=1 Tax=unclassified Leifsonia TaxID=2663824 RepID=UPI0006F39DAD|nr:MULTISPECIES: hypothetical protein [unclassified Leifsonia]KQX07200.1 hypothetical protein ASC59_05230 [Leifsonia sp. Root1293]KRA11483.1 hypothetical protein ASD61_05230 [Leifsonia sp. Root60]
MGIQRTVMSFERDFTQIPNAWLRDIRLSRRAKGLLAELMTHRVGWHISIASLQAAGTEGRDAIRKAIAELASLGYLEVSQARGGRGRFNEVEYELSEPTGVGFSVTGGFTDSGATDIGESDTKKTISTEHEREEDTLVREFAEFWYVYPRKTGKADARRAFKSIRRTTELSTIMAGVRGFALLQAGGDKRFVMEAAKWLHGRRWEDEEQIPAIESRSPAETPLQLTQYCSRHPDYVLDFRSGECASCERQRSEVAS